MARWLAIVRWLATIGRARDGRAGFATVGQASRQHDENEISSEGSPYQVSADSVDSTARVTDEVDNLVTDCLHKLSNAGDTKKSRLSQMKSRMSKSAKLDTSQESCIRAMDDFREVLSLWSEWCGDVKDQTRAKATEERMNQAISRVEARSVSSLQTSQRRRNNVSETGLQALGNEEPISEESTMLKDHKRQLLVKLYGEMSYFLGNIMPEIKKRGFVKEITERFTGEINQFETRLLIITLTDTVHDRTHAIEPAIPSSENAQRKVLRVEESM